MNHSVLRILRPIAACLAVLLTAACTYETVTVRSEFALSRYSVAFATEGGTTTVTVSANETWSASTDASWLTLAQGESILKVSAEANESTAEVRKAVIAVVSDSGDRLTLEAIQEPADPVTIEVNCGSASRLIDSEGGSYTFSVTCNYAWTATLAQEVQGWTLSVDPDGVVSVLAEANSGNESKTGTILIQADYGGLHAEESVEVTQISRAENSYYQCIGEWAIYADNWYSGKTDMGVDGTYDSCTIAELDYRSGRLSLLDIGLTGTQCDRLEFDKATNTLTLPVGYMIGGTYSSNGFYYYLYLTLMDMSGNFASKDLTCTLSDDGQTITVEDLPGEYPFLGVMGLNVYMGYTYWTNVYYPTGHIELRKKAGSGTTALPSKEDGPEIVPVDVVPEGVPQRLTAGKIDVMTFTNL